MKKLNNKGFAISTLLYGILTMIVLILTLLLSIMRSSYNKNIIITDDVEYYMNKCASRQAELESCYQEYNANPASIHDCGEEYDRYSVCLGLGSYSYVAAQNSGFLKDIIMDNADSKASGLVIDRTDKDGERYVFTGANPNNYIKFGNRNGRILSIESTGAIKVVLTDEIITSELDKKTITATTDGSTTNSISRWLASTLYNNLQLKYNNMEYTSKLTKAKFYTGIIYSSNNTKTTIETLREEYAQDRFGILSVDDYLRASASTNCNLNSTTSITTTFTQCKDLNWLASSGIGSFWTSNLYGDLDNYATYSNSGVNQTKVTTTGISSYMVIVLKDNITAGTNATGEKTNPYVVEVR